MVKTGSSYLSQSELPLTLGLGAGRHGRGPRGAVAERTGRQSRPARRPTAPSRSSKAGALNSWRRPVSSQRRTWLGRIAHETTANVDGDARGVGGCVRCAGPRDRLSRRSTGGPRRRLPRQQPRRRLSRTVQPRCCGQELPPRPRARSFSSRSRASTWPLRCSTCPTSPPSSKEAQAAVAADPAGAAAALRPRPDRQVREPRRGRAGRVPAGAGHRARPISAPA